MEASLPQYWRERGFTHRSPGLVRALAQLEFGDQELDNMLRARAWLENRPHWSGAHVFDTLLSRLEPRTAVEKSPENVATVAALRRLARAYPNARYVHLTRSPITTQVSMVQHRMRTVPSHPLDGQPMAGIAAWLTVHERIVRLLARLPPERVMRVRAEDVLNDPEWHLSAIAVARAKHRCRCDRSDASPRSLTICPLRAGRQRCDRRARSGFSR
jgi:Sulfotransferase family